MNPIKVVFGSINPKRAIKFIFFLIFLIILSSFAYSYNEWCYQEFANSSDECGNDAGSYSIWDDGAKGYLEINYTTLNESNNESLLRLRMGELGDVNYSILPSCWNDSILQFRIKSSSGQSAQGSRAYCWNGSVWEQFLSNTAGSFNIGCTGTPNTANMIDGEWNTYSAYLDGCNAFQKNPALFDSISRARVWEEGMYWHLNCVPSWSCSGYASCNTSDSAPCNSTTDLNSCNVSYTGNYSEFTPQACNYCSEDFQRDQQECILHVRQINWTDDNFGSCCNVTSISADCDNPYTNSEACSIFSYEADDIPRTVIDMVTTFILSFSGFATIIIIMGLVLLWRGTLGKIK